jgi:hypothetical protein
MTGDTAVPFPSDANETVPEKTALSPSQQQRVEALSVAANLLRVVTGPFGIKTTLVKRETSVGDLTYLAEWILEGSEDLADDPEEEDQTEEQNRQAENRALLDGQIPGSGAKDTAASQSDVCGARQVRGISSYECELNPGHECDHVFSRLVGRALADNPQA